MKGLRDSGPMGLESGAVGPRILVLSAKRLGD